MIVIVQRDTMYPCITVTNICISRFNSRAAQSARYTLTRTLARVDYDRLRPVNHSPSLLPRFCSFYSRNVTIALIVETGSKTIVTSRDKETATFENKRANKLVLSGVSPPSPPSSFRFTSRRSFQTSCTPLGCAYLTYRLNTNNATDTSRDNEGSKGGERNERSKEKETRTFLVDVDLGVGVEILIGSGCE